MAPVHLRVSRQRCARFSSCRIGSKAPGRPRPALVCARAGPEADTDEDEDEFDGTTAEAGVRISARLMRDGRPLIEYPIDNIFDALKEEKGVNEDDMDYWFRENPADFQPERVLQPAEEVPNEDFTVRNERWNMPSIEALSEGMSVYGEIVAIHLLHGAVVDLGLEYHGMIPVTEAQWPSVLDHFKVGEFISATVYKLREPKIFRFPVQLHAEDPKITQLLTPPEQYRPPIHIDDDTDPWELIRASCPDYTPTTIKDPIPVAPSRTAELDYEEVYREPPANLDLIEEERIKNMEPDGPSYEIGYRPNLDDGGLDGSNTRVLGIGGPGGQAGSTGGVMQGRRTSNVATDDIAPGFKVGEPLQRGSKLRELEPLLGKDSWLRDEAMSTADDDGAVQFEVDCGVLGWTLREVGNDDVAAVGSSTEVGVDNLELEENSNGMDDGDYGPDVLS